MFLSDRPSPALTLPVGPHDLDEAVMVVDRTVDDETGPVLIRLAGIPPKLGLLCLTDGHPLDSLLGFRAPLSWLAMGVRCHARVHSCDEPFDVASGRAVRSGAHVDAAFTMLIDRSGHGAGLMREGDAVRRLDGAPEGVLADACRRALGLSTAPPPSTSAELWLRLWLDRVVEHATAVHPQIADDWEAVARLHPAAPAQHTAVRIDHGPPLDPLATADPHTLAEATLCLAEAWPWSRLRHEPEVVDGDGPPVPADLAAWMDDGMFARWVLAETAELTISLRAVGRLLSPAVADRIADTLRAGGLGGPGGAEA